MVQRLCNRTTVTYKCICYWKGCGGDKTSTVVGMRHLTRLLRRTPFHMALRMQMYITTDVQLGKGEDTFVFLFSNAKWDSQFLE